MYISQTACVQWKNEKSDLFAVQNGVKQGGVLSPTLFNIYLDELLRRLKENGAGCHIGRTWCGSLSYADDVVLLSPSLCGIKEMLNICKEYAMEYKMLFNASKSKLIVLSDDQLQTIPLIHFMGGVIAQVQVDKHLGILIGNIDEKAKIDALCREMTKQCVMLRSHFSLLTPDIKYFLFKTYAMPLYGSHLVDLGSPHVKVFCTAWRKAIRSLLGLPFMTHGDLLHLICDDMNIIDQLHLRFLKFLHSTSSSHNDLVRLCYLLV
jgi:hypothetical protein